MVLCETIRLYFLVLDIDSEFLTRLQLSHVCYECTMFTSHQKLLLEDLLKLEITRPSILIMILVQP